MGSKRIWALSSGHSCWDQMFFSIQAGPVLAREDWTWNIVTTLSSKGTEVCWGRCSLLKTKWGRWSSGWGGRAGVQRGRRGWELIRWAEEQDWGCCELSASCCSSTDAIQKADDAPSSTMWKILEPFPCRNGFFLHSHVEQAFAGFNQMASD